MAYLWPKSCPLCGKEAEPTSEGLFAGEIDKVIRYDARIDQFSCRDCGHKWTGQREADRHTESKP